MADDDRDDDIKIRQEEKRYAALTAAHKAGRIQILVDAHVHNTGKSPAYETSENLIPLLILIVLAFVIMLFHGLIIGTVVLLLAVFVYVFGVRSWIMSRVEKRVAAAIMEDLRNWRTYWKIGGVAISLTDRPELGVAAPKGDWKAFVQLHVGEVRPQSSVSEESKKAEVNALSPFAAEPKPRPQKKPPSAGGSSIS